MTNPIRDKLIKLQDTLSSKRSTGRTSKMIDDIIDKVSNETDQKIIVLHYTQDVAKRTSERFRDRLSENMEVLPGSAIKVNGNLIIFKI